MKHFISIKNLNIILFLCFLFSSCVYTYMTHLSGDELEWVTNRKKGEVMYFKSQSGDIETVTILEISVFNTLDPINWAYLNIGKTAYHARAMARFYFDNRMIGESFRISKKSKEDPIVFTSSLLSGWLYDVPLKLTSLRINGVMLKDLIFLDNESSEKIREDENVTIKNYYWSRKYGLVQYTYSDGTVFTRTDID